MKRRANRDRRPVAARTIFLRTALAALILPLGGCTSPMADDNESAELRAVSEPFQNIGAIGYDGMRLRFDRMDAIGLTLSKIVDLAACDSKALYAVQQETQTVVFRRRTYAIPLYELWFSNDGGEHFTKKGVARGPHIACDHAMLASLSAGKRLYTAPLNADGSLGSWADLGQVDEVDEIEGGDGTFYGVRVGSPGNNSVLTASNMATGTALDWGDSIATVGAILVTGTGARQTGTDELDLSNSLAWPRRAFALEASGTVSYNDHLLDGSNYWTTLNTGNERYFTITAAASSDPRIEPNVLFGLQNRNGSGTIELNRIRITESNCNDGVDNDANGLTDGEDWQCEDEAADNWCAGHANGTYCAARYQDPWFRDQPNQSSSLVRCQNGVATSVTAGVCQQLGSQSDYLLSDAALIIPEPAGYGHWCNGQWSSGGWALIFTGNTPCDAIINTGGRVVRSGLYSLSGRNQVLANCSDGAFADSGNGTAPLQNVFDTVGHGTNRCVFTISPDRLPVFERMFDPANEVPDRVALGFVHDDNPLINRFGTTCSTTNLSAPCNGEQAYDHALDEGTAVYAVAAGKVIFEGSRQRSLVSTSTCGGTPNQGEVYVEHNVGSNLYYRESFVVYYAHLRKRLVQPGQTVKAGQILGYVGATGCTGGFAHLHTGVFRLSNVNAQKPGEPEFGWHLNDFFQADSDPSGNNMGNTTAIDALGWAGSGLDPWGHSEHNAWTGYEFTGKGAWSIALFKTGQAFVYP